MRPAAVDSIQQAAELHREAHGVRDAARAVARHWRPLQLPLLAPDDLALLTEATREGGSESAVQEGVITELDREFAEGVVVGRRGDIPAGFAAHALGVAAGSEWGFDAGREALSLIHI